MVLVFGMLMVWHAIGIFGFPIRRLTDLVFLGLHFGCLPNGVCLLVEMLLGFIQNGMLLVSHSMIWHLMVDDGRLTK